MDKRKVQGWREGNEHKRTHTWIHSVSGGSSELLIYSKIYQPRYVNYKSLAGHLVLSKMPIRHLVHTKRSLIFAGPFGLVQNVHKTFGPLQNVLDIWSYLVLSKTSMETLIHTKRPLIFAPKPFGMDQIYSWISWIRSNFKGLLAWTKCLLDILNRIKYLPTYKSLPHMIIKIDMQNWLKIFSNGRGEWRYIA